MKKYYTTSNATVMFNIVAGSRPVLLKTVKECSDTNLKKHTYSFNLLQNLQRKIQLRKTTTLKYELRLDGNSNNILHE